MAMEISSDGFFLELSAINRKGIQVFPHVKSIRDGGAKGLAITVTGKKEDYYLVDLESFVNHIANGDFDEIGRVRMKPRNGGQSNGFAVRKATMSEKLLSEIERRKRK